MTAILYTLAIISLGALVGRYLYKRRFDKNLKKVKSEIQKSLDIIYQKDFESEEVEKAQAETIAIADAHQNAEKIQEQQQQEEATIAQLAEQIRIEATLEIPKCRNKCGHRKSKRTASSLLKTKRKKKPTQNKKTKDGI